MSNRIAVFNRGAHRAGRHAARDLRPSGDACSSPASSAPATCCPPSCRNGCWVCPPRTRCAPSASASCSSGQDVRRRPRCPSTGTVTDVQYLGADCRVRVDVPDDRQPLGQRAERRARRRRHRRARPPGLVAATPRSPSANQSPNQPKGRIHEDSTIRRVRGIASRCVAHRMRQRARSGSERHGASTSDRHGREGSSTSSSGPATPRTAAPTRRTTGSTPFEKESGCNVKAKIGRHERRDVQPDADRPVRRRVGLRRRQRAPHRRRPRRAGEHRARARTTPTCRRSSRTSRTTRAAARTTASRTAGAPTT